MYRYFVSYACRNAKGEIGFGQDVIEIPERITDALSIEDLTKNLYLQGAVTSSEDVTIISYVLMSGTKLYSKVINKLIAIAVANKVCPENKGCDTTEDVKCWDCWTEALWEGDKDRLGDSKDGIC